MLTIIRLVERFLEDEDEAEISKELLDSDNDLLNAVLKEVRNSQLRLDRMTIAAQLLERARNEIPGLTPQPLSHLYLLALQGDLLESPLFREFMLALKKTSSDLLSHIVPLLLPFLRADDQEQWESASVDLGNVLSAMQDPNQPIKSKHNVRNVTMRTTVVAQKVELSTHTASISEDEKKYSVVLDRFVELIERYMTENIVSVNDIMFSEIIVYDGLYPDSMVFMPRARSAIERALSAPQDYLNCDCCKETEEVS
jgi:origin recognition complex subunit 3